MQLYRVDQQVVRNPISDVARAVRQELDKLTIPVPQGEVAITVGSRGIHNIDTIVKAAGAWLAERGATPFMVPAMGSHNGATAQGQQAMVESLGMTEQAMGMPIRSSMECVRLGSVDTGDVWMDRHCYEAAGVLVLNRVKLHTCFSGTMQSGLTKMMVVGMGKIQSATTFHSTPVTQMNDMLIQMGQFLLDSGKIWAGLALLEDGNDETAELHAMAASEILTREPQLLQRHRDYFPSLPVEDIDVLVVDSIGKTYSGTGMDTNVVGYRGVKWGEDLESPRIKIIAALALAEGSQGNAIGVGLADFITRRLRDAIDERKTFINVVTTGDMIRMKIPATLSSDEELVHTIQSRFGDRRWMFIPNTLHLSTLYVTKELAEELASHPRCRVSAERVELTFEDGRHTLRWD